MKKTKEKSNLLAATGRRKRAIARVKLVPGTGLYTVNKKNLQDYFGSRLILKDKVLAPFKVCGIDSTYDVVAGIVGGGPVGQADALAHGIARALANISEQYKKLLRDAGLLTRDSRVKESKKYGRKKARKRFQFSKR